MQQVMAKNYCFTLNNPRGDIQLHDSVGYMVYQHEIGENGTLHYQGYLEFKDRTRITGIKKLGYPYDAMHLEVRKGTQAQAIAYCTKEDTRVAGTQPIHAGTPTQIGKARSYSAMVAAIARDEDVTHDDTHLEEYIKHKRSVDEVIRERKRSKREDIEVAIVLTTWQEELVTTFKEKPHPRIIHWRWEAAGNSGKTTFTKYLVKHHNAIMVDTTAKERVIRAYNQEPIVVFDINRAEGKEDRINYGIMEMLKNGMGFNTMYEPQMKLWQPPHVLVFSNFPPADGKLSIDRLDTYELPPLSMSVSEPAASSNSTQPYSPSDFAH